jgi:hypothetical protein
MTVGEVRDALAGFDGALELAILVPYEDDDGDLQERAYDIVTVEKHVDADTKGEYVCITCGDA